MRGMPLTFQCLVGKRERTLRGPDREDHTIVRTGITKPTPLSYRYRGIFPVLHEYRCACGATGWSAHPDVAAKPIEETER